jgi:hypothetical protein
VPAEFENFFEDAGIAFSDEKVLQLHLVLMI